MEKKQPKGQSHYIYSNQEDSDVSQQIMDSYNSGVIDQEDGQLHHYDSATDEK